VKNVAHDSRLESIVLYVTISSLHLTG